MMCPAPPPPPSSPSFSEPRPYTKISRKKMPLCGGGGGGGGGQKGNFHKKKSLKTLPSPLLEFLDRLSVGFPQD